MNNENFIKLKIKKEFKNLIRPLQRREYLQLEQNILQDGCLDPLKIWHGYIVDGHNRYEICSKHNISFDTIEMDFESDEEAIVWICANQLGRRNISEATRKFLIGMQYESEKIVCSKKNPYGINQYNECEDLIEENQQIAPNFQRSRQVTAQRIAEENHVSIGTVQKYAIFTRALETIGKKEPEIVPKILSGRCKVSHNNVVELSKMPEDKLKVINKRMNRGQAPFFQYSKSRNVIQSPSEEECSTVSIKSMPTFDPDAEVTELTLTIPSWISSIIRTRANANLSIISENAQNKLTDKLKSLMDTATEFLSVIEEAHNGRL